MTENAILLFSYGTLRQENVQMASFGRLLAGSPDALPGYTSVMVEITASGVVAASGAKFHPMVVETGDPADQVSGTLFLITDRPNSPLPMLMRCPPTRELRSCSRRTSGHGST
jgi:hypothetical protein